MLILLLIKLSLVYNPCDRKPCDPNASCNEVNNSTYNCTCNNGYYGNGTVCEGTFITIYYFNVDVILDMFKILMR